MLEKNNPLLFKDLKHRMLTHSSLNYRLNPVIKVSDDLTASQIFYILVQYSIFPRNIVSFLTSALDISDRLSYNALSAEIKRNIGEEQGSETENISHYDVLVTGITQEFVDHFNLTADQIESAFKSLQPKQAMHTFITTMQQSISRRDNPFYSFGSMYALEASAAPEISIIQELILKLTHRVKGARSELNSLLGSFLDMHLYVWEPGHEEGLRKEIDKLLSVEQLENFQEGFESTIDAMDTLWTNLLREAKLMTDDNPMKCLA